MLLSMRLTRVGEDLRISASAYARGEINDIPQRTAGCDEMLQAFGNLYSVEARVGNEKDSRHPEEWNCSL